MERINNKRKIFDNNDSKIRIIVNRNNNIKPKIDFKNDYDLLQKENKKIEDADFYNKFRNLIINNIHKEKRNKSYEKKENKNY